MQKTLRLSKTVTYFLIIGALVDGVLGAIFLLESGARFEKQPSVGWLVAGMLMAGGFYSLAGNFDQKTARNIIYYVGLLICIQTAAHAALFLTSLTPTLFLYTLTIGCDILIISGCFAHLKALRKST